VRHIQRPHGQGELLNPPPEPSGDELPGRPENWRPSCPDLHRPVCGVLVEVTNLDTELTAVEPRAIQHPHIGQQASTGRRFVDHTTMPGCLIAEPSVGNRRYSAHRSAEPRLSTIEIHRPTGQPPKLPRRQIEWVGHEPTLGDAKKRVRRRLCPRTHDAKRAGRSGQKMSRTRRLLRGPRRAGARERAGAC